MPLQQCQVDGKSGWRWGRQGKCYPGRNGKKRAIKQAIAMGEGKLLSNRTRVGLSLKVLNARRAGNPLKVDPTRTATLRRVFEADIARRFARLRRKIYQLIVEEDALGLLQKATNSLVGNIADSDGGAAGDDGAELVIHTRWQFRSNPRKVQAFQRWIAAEAYADIVGTTASKIDDAYWTKYVQEGYQKGAGRAFDDTRKVATWTPEEGAFYAGTKEEFLRSAFGRPVAIEKVKLLSGRVFTDLKGITEEMSTKMTRVLTDGLVQGQNPRQIARLMIKEGIGFTKRRGVQSRALTIARTEIIRTHAEGQLDAMERLGVVDVGVMVEWSATGDDRMCPACASLDGMVLKVKEARGIIPRHSSCRCALVPANVGESTKGQKRTKAEIEAAFDKSIRTDMPAGRVMKDGTRRFQSPLTGRFTLKRSPRTLAGQKRRSSWPGATRVISRRRPTVPAAARRIAARREGLRVELFAARPESMLRIDSAMSSTVARTPTEIAKIAKVHTSRVRDHIKTRMSEGLIREVGDGKFILVKEVKPAVVPTVPKPTKPVRPVKPVKPVAPVPKPTPAPKPTKPTKPLELDVIPPRRVAEGVYEYPELYHGSTQKGLTELKISKGQRTKFGAEGAISGTGHKKLSQMFTRGELGLERAGEIVRLQGPFRVLDLSTDAGKRIWKSVGSDPAKLRKLGFDGVRFPHVEAGRLPFYPEISAGDIKDAYEIQLFRDVKVVRPKVVPKPLPKPKPVVKPVEPVPKPAPTGKTLKEKLRSHGLEYSTVGRTKAATDILEEQLAAIGRHKHVVGRMKFQHVNIEFTKTISDRPGLMGVYRESRGAKPNPRIQVSLKQFKAKEPPLKLGGSYIGGDATGATIRHEYGHAYYYNGMSSVGRGEWKRQIAARYNKAERHRLVSKYGSKDADELFAESFTAYTHPQYRRGMLPKPIEDFMDNTVGKVVGKREVFVPAKIKPSLPTHLKPRPKA